MGIFDRAEILLGKEALEAIASKKVLLFGVGGVGSWCAESLIRTGITNLTIVDQDTVCESNINRQLMATTASVGQIKVEAMCKRLLEINPDAEINAIHASYTQESAPDFHLEEYDYIIDCIDSLKDKIDLLLQASRQAGAKVFSSMGAARKLDPTRIRVAEFWDVRGCPLGAAMRKRMRQNKWAPAKKIMCVYSEELLENKIEGDANGSLLQVTGCFGFTLTSLIINDICSTIEN